MGVSLSMCLMFASAVCYSSVQWYILQMVAHTRTHTNMQYLFSWPSFPELLQLDSGLPK